MAGVSHSDGSGGGSRRALRRLRAPLLPVRRTGWGSVAHAPAGGPLATAAPRPRLLTLSGIAVATCLVGLSVYGAVYWAQFLESVVGNFADFYGNVWWAGHQILDGKPAAPDGFTAWPPTATVFVAPIALLPYWVGLAVWTALSVGIFVVGLRLVGCRDRWALLVACLSPPALACVAVGNLSLVLAGGVAIAWAYRDRGPVPGLVTGALVAAKPWLWPILVYFVLTRRWVALRAAVAWCVAAVTLWLVLSPATIRAFPAWSDQMVETYNQWGIGLSSALVNGGLSETTASALALGAGLLVLAVATRAQDDLTIFTGCLAAALVASPLVWEHYYAVLFVPIAILAPRLGPLWFVPYLLGLRFLLPSNPTEFIAYGLAAVAATALVAGTVATRIRSRYSA